MAERRQGGLLSARLSRWARAAAHQAERHAGAHSVDTLVTLIRGSHCMDAALPYLAGLLNKTARITLHAGQLQAARALLRGRAVEMATGEGKTYALALAAAALGLIPRRRVHVATANAYLARRDARAMTFFFDCLGLTVDYLERHPPDARHHVYAANIVYGALTAFAFDCLRDHVRISGRACQHGHDALLIDELDAGVVDECTTPLVLSTPGPAPDATVLQAADCLVKPLQAGAPGDLSTHIEVDRGQHSLCFTERGYEALERELVRSGILKSAGELYNRPLFWMQCLTRAAEARHLFSSGRDYLVRDQRVHVLNPVTARVEPGKRWGDGLHQAIEVKEGVPLTADNQDLASMTVQAYVLQYEHLAGISGSLQSVADTLQALYGLEIEKVDTHRLVRRDDASWVWVADPGVRLAWIVREVERCRQQHQPVLVGAEDVLQARQIQQALHKAGLECTTLTAENDEDEAAIIARAGEPGRVTVATALAGRGTDIRLAPAVSTVGLRVVLGGPGLDPRQDVQFRGRAGRQGEPGSTIGCVGPDSTLVDRHANAEHFTRRLERVGVAACDRVQHPWVEALVARAQCVAVGQRHDQRLAMLRYENVLLMQQAAFWQWRASWRQATTVDALNALLRDALTQALLSYCPGHLNPVYWRRRPAQEICRAWGIDLQLTPTVSQGAVSRAVQSALVSRLCVRDLVMLRQRSLQTMDSAWRAHAETVRGWQAHIHLQAYAGQKPFPVYATWAARAFARLVGETIPRSIAATVALRDTAPGDRMTAKAALGRGCA